MSEGLLIIGWFILLTAAIELLVASLACFIESLNVIPAGIFIVELVTLCWVNYKI